MSLDAEVRALRNGFALSASVRAGDGETVAVLGPNGAGKSTLVSALAGLLPLRGGRVVLDAMVLDDPGAGLHAAAEERSIGVVFQDRRLFPHLSVGENVAFPLRARGIGKREAATRARGMLERVGVRSPEKDVRELSGGEAQRAALARALVHRPRLLLLDEPLAALDAGARGDFRALLAAELAGFGGVSVIVTHDPVDALTLATRIVVIENGAVVQSGTTAEIRDAPRTAYAAEFAGVNLFTGRLSPEPGGAGILHTAHGHIVVAWPAAPREPIEEIIALLRPADVALFAERPEGSARNVLRGAVTSVAIERDRARVRLATTPPVVAEVTGGSVERLGIRPGTELWAAFKAVEVRLVLP
jgi:molybdate transport system ATP-binding protein